MLFTKADQRIKDICKDISGRNEHYFKNNGIMCHFSTEYAKFMYTVES